MPYPMATYVDSPTPSGDRVIGTCLNGKEKFLMRFRLLLFFENQARIANGLVPDLGTRICIRVVRIVPAAFAANPFV